MSDERREAPTLRRELTRIAEAECWTLGGTWFMGRPERWWETPTWRCENDHVSLVYLRCEESPHARCLAADCGSAVHLTFPEDTDGPLVAPIHSGSQEADRG